MKKNILVVDDDKNMTRLLEVLLKTDYEVTIAHSLKEGTENLSLNTYDAVILDLNLNKEEGNELVRYIRSQENLEGLPVIVLSGHDKSEYRIRSFEDGADDYISKPFNPQELKVRLKRFFRKSESIS